MIGCARRGIEKILQVMVDKTAPIPRLKMSQPIGVFDSERMRAVESVLMLVAGPA